ncbi:hydroxymethylbilane synthase [soil metagenome]
MTQQILRIATRKSPLALIQAQLVKQALHKHFPELIIVIVPLSTEGDKLLDEPLATVGGKGLFVKELEQALLHNKADIAVHSMKDVPAEFPPGLMLAAICERDDPRDVLIAKDPKAFGTIRLVHIGTASLRRQTQIRHLYPNLQVKNLRGNVNSRLKRLDDGDFQGLILAAAGLHRLGFTSRINHYFNPLQFIPAAGQGAIGIECREQDVELRNLLTRLHHPVTASCVVAERALTHRLEGGCQAPIAAYAQIHQQTLEMVGLVGHPDGTIVVRSEIKGEINDAEQLGKQLAEELLAKGADKILQQLPRASK